MKWGIRRYENPDGTLTAAGKRRYGDEGKYTYKSEKTIRTERKALKAKLEGKGRKANRLQKKAQKSKVKDALLENYTRQTSTGKLIAQTVLFGKGARKYQAARAKGNSRAVAVGKTLAGPALLLLGAAALHGAVSHGDVERDDHIEHQLIPQER